MDKDGNGWVVLTTFNTDWEAHIAKGVLDDAGIPSVIQNEEFSWIYPIGFNTLGGIPLLVPAGKVPLARKILKL